MCEFGSASEYVIAASTLHDLACVPFQVAADALGIGRSAVDARVRGGKLETIKIGRVRYITLASVKRQIDDWQNEVTKVKILLETEAHKGTRTLNYNPVMGIVGRKTTTPNDRTVIGRILGEISRKSFADNGFLLTAMVVQSGSGQPSGAFYDLAEELDPSYSNAATDVGYHKAQIDLIQAHYASS